METRVIEEFYSNKQIKQRSHMKDLNLMVFVNFMISTGILNKELILKKVI